LRELLFTSELIDASRALEIGLVNRVVSPNELESTGRQMAASVLQGAPHAIANSKRLIEQLWSSSVADDVALALRHHMEARESDEAKEGIAAFLEKRRPNWL
jgi:enoyl-CoA hydratase/carnithine racemase